MIIDANISSFQLTGSPRRSSAPLAKSLARLSTGPRFVPRGSAVDPARSIELDAQIRRNLAASADVRNAVTFSEIQDELLQKVQGVLDRMEELNLLARDTSQTESDLASYRSEFTCLQNYISDITGKQFNGIRLFGSEAPALATTNDKPPFSLNAVDLAGGTSIGVLNAYCGISISNSVAADHALREVRVAIQTLANLRTQVGANLQRLKFTREQLSIANENLSAANHHSASVGRGPENTELVCLQLLQRTGATMLAAASRSAKAGVPIFALKLRKQTQPTTSRSGNESIGSGRGQSSFARSQEHERVAPFSMTPEATVRLPEACVCFRSDGGMEAA